MSCKSHVRDIQNWLLGTTLGGLIVPSTDEFLSEWAPPANRRLRWATSFRGSVGVAVILRDAAALFLDGRYLLQGHTDTAGTEIAIRPGGRESRRAWLKTAVRPASRLGMDPWVHSKPDLTEWQGLAQELCFKVELLSENPIDRLWVDGRPASHQPTIVDYPVRFAGENYKTKCSEILQRVRESGLEALLVADPEDVSWLLNVRAAREALKTEVGDMSVVPSCTSRALLLRDGTVTWYVDRERLTTDVLAREEDLVTVAPSDRLCASLREVAQRGPIGADLRRTPVALTRVIEEQGELVACDAVARHRWRKHAVEVQGAKRAHIVDASAVIRFIAWLEETVRTRPVTEFEAAERLESLRNERPEYMGPSMPLMSASGPDGAQPHYVPQRAGSRKLNDHPIYWMDSGGQYFGGTTDNTFTIAVGVPDSKHMVAHTLVLKGYIALASARIPAGACGVHLDTIARQALWAEGMNYAHSTGHGVGNYLNIHEGVLIGGDIALRTTIAIEPGMIITNEPGYYIDGDFGLRIESHMVAIESAHLGFIEFETISRLPIDPNLVDFERLSRQERQWLADYHCTVLRDVGPLLDEPSAAWLRRAVGAFARAAAT